MVGKGPWRAAPRATAGAGEDLQAQRRQGCTMGFHHRRVTVDQVVCTVALETLPTLALLVAGAAYYGRFRIETLSTFDVQDIIYLLV